MCDNIIQQQICASIQQIFTMQVVAHPALYSCLTGNIAVLKLLAQSGLLTDELETALLETSTANGHHDCVEFIECHYIDSRAMDALPASKQARKVERVCAANGGTLDGYV
jgi:hypothetical protein